MLLRNHPLMCYQGIPNWPPVWSWTRDGENPKGEVSILKTVKLSTILSVNFFQPSPHPALDPMSLTRTRNSFFEVVLSRATTVSLSQCLATIRQRLPFSRLSRCSVYLPPCRESLRILLKLRRPKATSTESISSFSFYPPRPRTMRPLRRSFSSSPE